MVARFGLLWAEKVSRRRTSPIEEWLNFHHHFVEIKRGSAPIPILEDPEEIDRRKQTMASALPTNPTDATRASTAQDPFSDALPYLLAEESDMTLESRERILNHVPSRG
jgi:hypothetical protein